MAISPFRPDARGMTAAVPQMASVYNDLKQGTPFKAGGGPGLDAWRSPAIAQSAAGLGMPTGGPALDLRSLDGATQMPNPGAGMGPWGGGPPRVVQNAGQMDPRLAGARGATQQSPWAAYGGAFGGVNQNDLYRKNAPNTAGPNGMMGPAPNIDFNAQARSQVGGQGAALAASKPWEGVFGDLWRQSTDSEFRQLQDARARGQGSLFGAAPKGSPDQYREYYNPDTGVSYGYGQGFGVRGEQMPDADLRKLAAEADPNSYAASMSDTELAEVIATGHYGQQDTDASEAKAEAAKRKLQASRSSSDSGSKARQT